MFSPSLFSYFTILHYIYYILKYILNILHYNPLHRIIPYNQLIGNVLGVKQVTLYTWFKNDKSSPG